MSRKKPTTARPQQHELDQARDELFSYIHRCGVLRATPEDQIEWMNDTIAYLGECFPSLSREQLGELQAIGLRFCRPVIDNVQVDSTGDEDGSGEASAAAA